MNTLNRVSESGLFTVEIADSSKIFLSVGGEEESPVDITPFASQLLTLYTTLCEAELPKYDTENGVDFATLSADKDVSFSAMVVRSTNLLGFRL